MKLCFRDCVYYHTKTCMQDGAIFDGYDKFGAEVCPMFKDKKEK